MKERNAGFFFLGESMKKEKEYVLRDSINVKNTHNSSGSRHRLRQCNVKDRSSLVVVFIVAVVVVVIVVGSSTFL